MESIKRSPDGKNPHGKFEAEAEPETTQSNEEKEMTDAEKALEELIYGHNAVNMGYEEIRVHYEIIRNALKSQDKPVEVTVARFQEDLTHEGYVHLSKTGDADQETLLNKHLAKAIAKKYPNGLKIIEGCDHGS